MLVGQAIYSSTDDDVCRGYRVVSKSPSLSEEVAHSLIHWNPSHGGLNGLEVNAESLNFFQPAPDWFAISRTIYGDPEFSQRGGLCIVTVNLLLRRQQLAEFDYDILSCLRATQSSGLLTLPLKIPRVLPDVTIPKLFHRRSPGPVRYDASELIELLLSDHRLAILNVGNPMGLLDSIFAEFPPIERLKMSFATGLNPSSKRDFKIHFFPESNPKLKSELSQLGFCIREPREKSNDLCPGFQVSNY